MSFIFGFKSRVTTGCTTCRIRRIKCDETKPICNRCLNTGRTCDGYSNAPIPRPRTKSSGKSVSSSAASVPDPARKITLPTFDDSQQIQAFEFFVNCTCTISPMYYGSDFWSTRVLQLSLTEPAIRYALCSLSLLHRGLRTAMTTNTNIIDEVFKRSALQQYTKGINHTQRLLAKSSNGAEDLVIKGLVACILFVCYENILLNHATAQLHLQNGLRILSRYKSLSSPPSSTLKCPKLATIPTDICRTLLRLDLQAMTFSGGQTPYPFHSFPDPPMPPDILLIDSLSTPDEALSYLVEIFRYIYGLCSATAPSLLPQHHLDQLATTATAWDTSFHHLISTLPVLLLQKANKTIQLTNIYRLIITALIESRCYGRECLHDNLHHLYTTILDLVTQLLPTMSNFSTAITSPAKSEPFFSLELGLILPLFFTALKCRDPFIRRRAIKLMQEMRHQEGSWESSGAAAVGQWIVATEEEGLGVGGCVNAGQVGEGMRIHVLNTDMEEGRRKIGVSGRLCVDWDNWQWIEKSGEVEY